MKKKRHEAAGLILTISFLPPAIELLQPSAFSGRFHNGHYTQPVLKNKGAIQVDYSHNAEVKAFNP